MQIPRATSAEPGSYMEKVPASWKVAEQIGIVLDDHVTALDVIWPHDLLGGLAGATIHFVADSIRPIPSENGLILMATATFETCLKDLDVILIVNGTACTLAAMWDPAMLAFPLEPAVWRVLGP